MEYFLCLLFPFSFTKTQKNSIADQLEKVEWLQIWYLACIIAKKRLE